MKRLFQNQLLKNYILLLVLLMMIEVIFRIVSNLHFNDWAMLRIFIGINTISLFLSILFNFFKKSIDKILMIIALFSLSFYSLIQVGLNNYLGLYMSFGTTSQVMAVKDYIFDYIKSFEYRYYLLLLPVLFLILYYVFFDKKLTLNEDVKVIYTRKVKKAFRHIFTYTILITLCALYYSTLSIDFMQNKMQIRTNKSLFYYPSLTNVAVNQFGINMYLIIDIKSIFISNDELEASEEVYSNKEKEEVVTDYTRYIDDYSWNQVILNEKNTTFNKLNQYYINKGITSKNEYTGFFEGKNLIVIMMESVNDILIDETYYPNFYKLYTEGWHWENNYSPRNSCSTGNNELTAMTSLFSINSSCTANRYKNNIYFESIFNLFNNVGYTTSSYHNYSSAYYYRDTIHRNMGSGKFYSAKALNIPYSGIYEEWPSDVLLMENSFEKYINEEKFMVWMTTVSSHQPYTVSSELGDKHLYLFKDTSYSTTLKRYMSKLKELDLGLGVLLHKLEESGKLDDTVIILLSDHYPYGINTKILKTYNFKYDIDLNYEKEKTPFVIYNSKIQSKTFSAYTTGLNILPTVANLFNLNYDPRLYAGTDLFSNDYENITIFADGSWQSPIAFYNSKTGKIIYNSDKVYTSEEIISINDSINTRISMSNLSITKNYFKYLNEALNKYPKESGF